MLAVNDRQAVVLEKPFARFSGNTHTKDRHTHQATYDTAGHVNMYHKHKHTRRKTSGLKENVVVE